MSDAAQVLVNSLITGSIYLLAGTGLTLTYGLSRFPNFAFAEFLTFGAYIGYLTMQYPTGCLSLALVTAALATGLLSLAAYCTVFRPLINRRAALIPLMIASIGLGYVIRYSLGECWSWSALSYQQVWQTFTIGDTHITLLWLYLILAAAATSIVLHLLFVFTRIGKAIRATAANPELAQASGINTERVTLFVWFVGGALAGVAGVFRAADTQLYPMLGWDILLPVFASVVLGGIGSFYGLLIAAAILGIAENFGVVALQALGLSTEYRMAVAFLVLILVLIFRPRGLGR
jgi:branched-subunit amino acid ABC-type transport system permease component